MSQRRDLEFERGFFEGVLRHGRDNPEVIEILGGLYTQLGRIADGLRMDRRLVRLRPENPTAHYNLACSLALSRRRADALRALDRAVQLGYRDAEWLQKDPDLDGLKHLPEFGKLLLKLKG